ncbi:MAG: ATP-binding protein [Acidobacteria bacterium]|nr:MAG: ATP-binding protein [Acidobacteriota bacterium]
MSDFGQNRAFFAHLAEDLTGRERELERLGEFAESGPGRALLVSSAPGTGASEILKALYENRFVRSHDTVPVYFKFEATDATARDAAQRFLHEFLLQLIAFRRGEPGIATSFPGLQELEGMAPPADEAWIRDLIRSCYRDTELSTDAAFIAKALGTPQRAAVVGAKSLVILDGLEASLIFESGSLIPEALGRIYANGDCSVILSGNSSFVSEAANQGRFGKIEAERMSVEPLEFEDAGRLFEAITRSRGVESSEQARDLAVKILGCRTYFIQALLDNAAEHGSSLRNFREVLACYFDSALSGRIAGYYDDILISAASGEKRTELLELLESAYEQNSPTDLSSWVKRLRSADALRYLESKEVISLKAGRVLPGASEILKDYVRSRTALEVRGEPEAKIVSRGVGEGLKRAAGKMAAHYRGRSSLGIASVLASFDCQTVPAAMFDYQEFKKKFKGTDRSGIIRKMSSESKSVLLPQVFHSDSAAAFYGPLSRLIESDRVALAVGFENAQYDDENEVTWIAAEIDSKLEANEELTAFWCDRLEMVAVANDIRRFKTWLIAPEGFSQAATEVLKSRGAYGSSKEQALLLKALLTKGEVSKEEEAAANFSFTIPIGDDTELIAAHAVEDIARRSGFKPKEINQIKTALVEACINAAEHSLSPDKKIRVDAGFDGTALLITVSNRGVRFAGSITEAEEGSEQRRGWGLRLIRSLMDDVRYERVDDGSRLTMSKKKRG